MENKKILGVGAIVVIGGLVICCLICCANMMNKKDGSRYMMSDGSMMHNSAMDMTSMMADMNAQLAGKTGDSFDQSFLSEMIVHHHGAVEMAQLALENSKHQEIKNLANDIIKAQNSEIAQMKAWQNGWYGMTQ